MQPYMKFYNILEKYYPEMLEMGKEVFGFEGELNTKIAINDPKKSILVSPLFYNHYERRLDFSPMTFNSYVKEELFKNRYGFENWAKVSIGHEASHQIHDAKSEYTLFKEEKNLDSMKLSISKGISEGVAEYGSSKILERKGLRKIKKLEDKLIFKNIQSYANSSDLNSLLSLLNEKAPIPTNLEKDILLLSTIIEYNIAQRYRKIFEKKCINYFRKFTKEWRPSQIDESDIKNFEQYLRIPLV